MEAERRYAGIVAIGKAIPWEAMRGYLEGKVTGNAVRRAAPRKLAK
ncbi:hypothetical protein LRK24_10035 [Rhodanobacter denitrificans]|nr:MULTISPECIES: hypothetical protein [Rhodanobacter]EIL98404.1 hypothetical protein UUC_17350 [Rhodanobacter denitrificans]UJJ58389.1 hypothetical protein LRK55_17405 [Rhodanobacter denitrificans]UJM88803.1 hypothetical protein LRK24_10035 [Rhodanobacter denitrificans]